MRARGRTGSPCHPAPRPGTGFSAARQPCPPANTEHPAAAPHTHGYNTINSSGSTHTTHIPSNSSLTLSLRSPHARTSHSFAWHRRPRVARWVRSVSNAAPPGGARVAYDTIKMAPRSLAGLSDGTRGGVSGRPEITVTSGPLLSPRGRRHTRA